MRRILLCLSVAVLAVGLLASYGLLAPDAHAQSCGKDEVRQKGECVSIYDDKIHPNLPVKPDKKTYKDGDTITVTGSVNKTKDYAQPITIKITGPNGEAGFGQANLKSDDTFQAEFLAKGQKWKASGTYTLDVFYGKTDKSTIRINFEGSSYVPKRDAARPATPSCSADEELINNKCVPKEKEVVTPAPPPPPAKLGVADFVTDDPKSYVDRYLDETDTFKDWFDKNYPQYDSIYQAVGLPDPSTIPPPPPPVDPKPVEPAKPECGKGTVLKDGICQIVEPPTTDGDDRRNTCLIATAAYGSELAPQVQLLREIRDGTLYSTASGTSFMTGFNQFYYAFSPTIADWERQSPVFRDMVRVVITPLLSSLGIMTLADPGSEAEVLGYGMSVIALNIGMYIAAPVGAAFAVGRIARSRLAKTRA